MNLRSINTKIWQDAWFETLSTEEKLLFIYLLTNDHTTIVGVYELSVRRMAFETGLSEETIRKGFERFEMVTKAFLIIDSFVFLPNFLKHQRLNTNMQKAAVKIFADLPEVVQEAILGNGYQTIRKDYQTIRNGCLKYEIGNMKYEIRNIHDVYNTQKNQISEKKEKVEVSKADSMTVKNDYLNQIIDVFCSAYFEARGIEYTITARAKERAGAKNILSLYKKYYPNEDSSGMLERLKALFLFACSITDDKFLFENMSIPIIVSQFNKLKIIGNNGRAKSSIAAKVQFATD